MRSLLTLLVALTALSTSAQTLFTEDFEGAPAFALNTSDANSASSANNIWVINNAYAGGSAESTCIIPVTFDVPATAGQPAGITSANGNYLHTLSTLAQSGGIQCCCFAAADGLCTDPDNIFARMTADVSTIGVSTVELKFWWLCAGGNQNYGEVYYSTNAGTSWTQTTVPITQYRNSDNWSEQTVSLPAFSGQATLRFGFRFHNGTALFGVADPGFGVDDVRIIGTSTGNTSIATGAVQTAICQGVPFLVPYTVTGTFNPGNMFTAQLSDAAGSFASPTDIGMVMTTTGGSISCSIPFGTPAGNGYRVRVVSDSPATTGTDNGANITIYAAPNAGSNSTLSVCSGDDPVAMSTGGDGGGTWNGPSLVVGGLYDPVTMEPGSYHYVVTSTGPCASDSAVVMVTEIPGANAGTSTVAVICKNTGIYDLFDYLGGTPDVGGTWTNPQGNPSDGTFNSSTANGGVYTYTVDPGGSCGADEAVVTVEVGLPGEAGPDDAWTACSTDLPVDLFDLLDASANLTGIWFSNGSPFNGTTTDPGAYVYIDYAQQPCSNDTAYINFTVAPAAYAGENSTLSVCSQDPPASLFAALGGSPQAGGTWTDPLGLPFPGSFNPLVDPYGLYSYTVSGVEPCSDDEAVVAVVPCTGIGENAGALTISWLGLDAQDMDLFRTPYLTAATVEVIDAGGRMVFQRMSVTINGELRVDLKSCAPGAYTLHVVGEGGSGIVRFMH